jgi:urease accessory protein
MRRVIPLSIALLPVLAHAHNGVDAGLHHGLPWMQGFVHPFTGLDHLAAMLTVGIWSVLSFRHQGRVMWWVPLSFASLLLVGGIAGVAGIVLPLVEPMIAVSLLALGLLVAWRVRLPLPMSAGLVGTFAVFHGLAHGSELPAVALVGMVAGTLVLHLSGMTLGHFVLARHVWLPRLAGFAVAAFGLGLLAGW